MKPYLIAAGVRIIIPYIVAVEPLDMSLMSGVAALKITTVGGAHQFTFDRIEDRDGALLRITEAIETYYERGEKSHGSETGEGQAEGVREGPAGEEGGAG